MTEKGPRYATVGDYLRVMRRQRLLITIVLVLSIGSALALSLSAEEVYTSQSRVSFRDPLQDLVLVGQGAQIFPDLAPAQRSNIQADLITSENVARRVRNRLEVDSKPSTLAAAITAEVDPQTNLVEIEASWSDPDFAADLANAYADEAKALGNAEAQERLGEAEAALRADLQDAKSQKPLPGIRISIIEANLQRLVALKSIAEPADIVQEAEAAGAPTSPQPTRDAVIGGILGLVIGIIAAFVRDALDRRLHNAQDIHDESGLPVLGRVAQSSFAFSGLVSNGHPIPTETDFEPFRVLRMNLGFLAGEGKAPRSVLVTSPLPQEGKSTVSIALASAAALAGMKVLLVECDLRRPSFSKRLPVEREPGLTNYLRGEVKPADILRVVDLAPPRSFAVEEQSRNGDETSQASGSKISMVVIPAGAAVTNAPELLQGERFEQFLEKVTRAYDLVILDGSPLLSVADPLELASEADAVLLCVRVQQTTRDQVRAARSALGHIRERPSGVVVTGIRPGDETYEYYYGY